MGKVTWGGVSAEDIDNADRSEFKPYDGPPVPDGVYAFKINWIRKAKSKAGNDKLTVGLELVPRRSRPDDKPYAGFFVLDGIPVMDSTTFRLAAFLDAIGVSGSDFVNRTSDDGSEKKNITKIGKVVPVGKYVLAQVVTGQNEAGQPRKEIAARGYWMPEMNGSAPEPAQESERDDAGTDNDPPF